MIKSFLAFLCAACTYILVERWFGGTDPIWELFVAMGIGWCGGEAISFIIKKVVQRYGRVHHSRTPGSENR